MNVWSIIEQVLKNPAVRAERESTSLHCSQAGISIEIDGRNVRQGGCRRRQFFEYHRYPKDEAGVDLDGLTKMEFGNFAEGLILDPIKIAGIYFGYQVPISIVRQTKNGVQYRINGIIDFLLKDPKTGKPEIGELKTVGAFGERGVINATKDNPLAPKIEHVLQVVPYIDWLTMPNQRVAVQDAKANILYLSREGKHNQHTVQLDPTTRHVIITNEAGTMQWAHITPEAIYADFDNLADAIAKGSEIENAPPPDYELSWTRETVIWKAEHGELNKTETETVKRKIANGEQGRMIEGGDWNCAWCPFSRGCWQPTPTFKPKSHDTPGSLVTYVQEVGSAGPGPQKISIAPTPGT